LDYDYLIIALGAELAPELIPGLSESAFTFYTFEGAERLGRALGTFRGSYITLVVSSVPYKCPGAPYEAAMLLANFFRKHGADVHIDIYTPEPQPMPAAGPMLGEAIKQMLTSRGIGFHPLHKLVSVDAQNRMLYFEGKEPVRYDMLIAIPPHVAPTVVR
jgi:sulfide:quinone oxidoreductase